jgi:hypothetical protein
VRVHPTLLWQLIIISAMHAHFMITGLVVDELALGVTPGSPVLIFAQNWIA